MNQNLKH